jgi:hypothetical protein
MSLRSSFHFFLLALVTCVSAAGLPALAVDRQPVVGSSNVAVADPSVSRPSTTPCEVMLFQNESFGEAGENTRMDATPHPYSYQPPTNCKGSWAKVVLEGDFSVDKGHQYDRTASVWLGGVNLYFGTTEEPSPETGPDWHVERDLTDYSKLFRTAQSGNALVNNWIDDKRASLIHGTVRLLFYPADKQFPAAKSPDAIYPLGDAAGNVINLQTSADGLSRVLTLPRNVERAYLDLFAQGQLHDEFWYNCQPDQYIDRTSAFAMKRGYKGAPVHPRGCGGGNFREVKISIDGKPAALAPIYPWVFTGGIDPFLWRPTPGVQTLNFMPYRIDLTPFAGMLSDGASHTFAITVLGSNHYFSVTGTLLIYQDAKATHTGGSITRNTLTGQSLTPAVTDTFGNATETVNGDILTRQQQEYAIEGFVNTSHGRVQTRVEQQLDFTDRQSFSNIDDHTYRQITDLLIQGHGVSRTTNGSTVTSELQKSFNFPLHLDVLKPVGSDESYTRIIGLHQGYEKKTELLLKGKPAYSSHITNTRISHDQSTYDPTHKMLSNSSDQLSVQSFQFSDSLGGCYHAELTDLAGKLLTYTTGLGCPNSINHTEWFSHPDGSPDSFSRYR